MPLTLVGQKKGMTQIFDEKGNLVVCTVVQVEPNVVLQIKSKAVHGYSGLQLGGQVLTESKAARISRPLGGFFAKIGVGPCRVVFESRIDDTDSYQVGQWLGLELFLDCPYVDIVGMTKGKGFQGVMKLFNMSGGPAAHGSGFHRHMGSTGMRSTPGRCFPGGKRASRMGGDQHTVQNLRVVGVKGNLLLVEGAVPGATSGTVFIWGSKKRRKKQKGKNHGGA